MSHAGRFLSPWLLALAVTAMTASEQKVTASPPAHLSADQAADFQQALTTLANQGHVTIVAEGTPLSSMPALDAAKLTAAAFLEDQIQTIADSYDYSVQRHGSVFVLRKRYSNPDDLPAVTPAECAHVLAQLPQIAEPFNPHGLSSHIQFLAPPGPNLGRDQVRILHPLVDAFADSLTADQNAAMQRHNLLVSSLTESQKTLARRLQLSLYVQSPMDNIALLPPKLKQAEQSALFCWQDTYNTPHVFGYTLPEQVNSQTIVRFHPLSHAAGWEDLGEGGLDPSPTGPDPTNPAQAPVQADTHPETLTEVVAALSVRPGAIHTDVDAAVGAKPVVLVGVGNASVSEVLHALADVYGLSLSAHHGALALTLPNVAPPAHLADLSATLRKTLPEPFARATHLTHIVEEEQNFYDFWRLPHPEYNDWVMQRHRRVSRRNDDFQAGLERIKQANSAFPALRIAAVRRLRALIEPKLQLHPSGIAISDLGEQEHEALAPIFLVEAIHAAGDLMVQKVPDTILQFDDASLSGGIQEDAHPPSFSLMFDIPNPPGGLSIDGGGIGIPYYKDAAQDDKKRAL